MNHATLPLPRKRSRLLRNRRTRASIHAHERPRGPRNRDPHTVPDAPIPPLQYAHSPSLYLSLFLSLFLFSPSPCPRPPDSQPSPKVAKASSATRCGRDGCCSGDGENIALVGTGIRDNSSVKQSFWNLLLDSQKCLICGKSHIMGL